MKKGQLPKCLINFFLLLISLFVAFGIVEFFLRIVWINPYLFTPIKVKGKSYSGYTRLHTPKEVVFNIEGLYKGAKRSLFRVSKNFFIKPASDEGKKGVIFLGGSTTECVYITEGKRWPERIADYIIPYNYGVSENTLLDSYYNLKFIINHKLVKANIVILMHGVNDLACFIKTNNPNIINNLVELIKYHTFGINPSLLERIKFFMKRIYTVSFLKYLYNKIFFRIEALSQKKKKCVYGYSVVGMYLRGVKSQNSLAPLSFQEYEEFFKSELLKSFLYNRERVFKNLVKFCRFNNLLLYILTQPHSFREDFHGFKYDLRTYFVIKGKRASLQQSSQLMDMINEHTRYLCKKYKVPLIDADKYFKKINISGLFYDSVHYTDRGADVLAKYIRRFLDSNE